MKNTLILLFLFLFEVHASAQNVKTIGNIELPPNFERIQVSDVSFGAYLRKLQLKENIVVLLYNGKPKSNQSAQFAVLKTDVGDRDLQQCADAYMRLEAEWLFLHKRYADISYNFTSGQAAKYSSWAEGYRPIISGNKVSWTKTKKPDSSYKNFRSYLDVVFSYAGTYSLNKELKSVSDINKIMPGDVFIQTGHPYGHAVTVADVAKNKETGEIIFLLIQSYMPAQEIHVLKNPENFNLSPWYSIKNVNPLETPEWIFNEEDLKRR